MADLLKNRVQDYVGTISDTSALAAWLTAGAKIIVDKIPLSKAERFSTTVTDAGSGIAVSSYRVLRAHKSSYNADLVDPGLAARVADSTSIFFALSTYPIAYITGGSLFIKPSGGTGIVIPYPSIAHGDDTITNFPSELEEAVIIYAAIRALQQKINVLITTTLDAVTITLPTAPTAPTVSAYTYTEATAQGITTVTIDLSALTPPGYTKVTSTLNIAVNQAKPSAPDFTGITAPTAPNDPAFTFTEVVPGVINTISIASSPTFTDYTDSLPGMPVFNIITSAVPTAPAFTDIDTDIVHTDISSLTVVSDTLIDLSTQFTALVTPLDTEEDIELATAKMEEIRTRIQEFNTEAQLALQQAIENARNSNDIDKFNAVQTLTANIQNYQLLLSKYSTQLDAWKGNLDSQYRQHQLNLQAWERESQNQLYTSLNTFNSKNAEYQAELNKKIEQARISLQEIIERAKITTDVNLQNKLQTTQTEIQDYIQTLENFKAQQSNYTVKINKILQEHRNNVEAWNIDRVTILQEASIKIQDELNEENIINSNYQVRVQELFKEADMNLAELIKEAELTTDVNKQNAIYNYLKTVEYTRDLISNYAQEIQSYAVKMNGTVQEFAAKIDQLIKQHEGLIKQSENLKNFYDRELQLHLG